VRNGLFVKFQIRIEQHLKRFGVHQRRNSFAVLGISAEEKFLERRIHTQNIQLVVKDHNAVGTCFNNPVCSLLCEPAHIRDAHLLFCHSANNGNRFFSARRIAARAAVELVLRIQLACLFELRTNLLFSNFRFVNSRRPEPCRKFNFN
jgi:hypothetical protein